MPRRTPARPREVFISHSGRDRAFVRKLAQLLKRHGIRSWFSEAHIAGAQQWHDEIGRALARCDWFLLVLSPHAVKSKWVKRELLYALQQDRYSERIAPVLRKPCDHAKLSWTLASFQMISFTANFEAGSTDLLRVWGIRSAGSEASVGRPHSG